MIFQSGLILYPTRQRLIESFENLLPDGKDTAVLTPNLLTFGQFEERLRAEILGPIKTLPPIGRPLLAASAAKKLYGGKMRGAFARSFRFKGFVSALVSFFDELGAGLIGPDELAKVTGYAPGKEEELFNLYKAYREELSSRGYMDEGILREGLVNALSHKTTFKTSQTLRKTNSIRLVDIYQFTPYRFEMIRRIAKWIQVTIVMPAPDDRKRAFGFIVTNVEKFEALADEENMLSIEYREPDDGPLSFFRSRLFALSPQPDENSEDDKGCVEAIRCDSRYREMEEVGAEIVRLKKEKNLPWSEFLIIMRNIHPYGAIVEDIFTRYSIPFHFRRGINLTKNPLVRSTLSIFDAIESGFSRNNVLRVLGSPYFGRYSKINADLAQKLFLTAGIIEGPSGQWRTLLAKRIKKENNRTRKILLEKIAKETVTLIKELERFSKKSRASQFAEELSDLLKKLRITPEPPPETPDAEKIRFRDHSAHSKLIEALHEMSGATKILRMGKASLGFQRIRDLFVSRLENMDTQEPGSINKNVVSVLNAHDAIGLSRPFVFICGAHEKEFPRYIENPSLLHEAEREKFNKAHTAEIVKKTPLLSRGLRVFDAVRDKWNEESLLFYQAAVSAREKLYLTFSTQELDGSPLMRSQFVNDALEALEPGLPSKEIEKKIRNTPHLAIQKDPEDLLDPEEKRTRFLKDIFRPDTTKDGETVEKRIAQNIKGHAKWKFKRLVGLAVMERERDFYFVETDPQEKAQFLSAHNGDIATYKNVVQDVLVKSWHGRYAPTDLEKYGQCPFRYFSAKLLGLEAIDEPVLEINALTRGTLLHDILENFYETLIKNKKARLSGTERELKILLAAASKSFRKLEKKGAQGNPFIFRIEKEKIENELAIWLAVEREDQAGNKFTPTGVEVCFDVKKRNKSTLEPLKVEMADGKMRYLVGSIDRLDIDEANNALRIIDYKSGANGNKYKEMVERENMGRTSFQPPIYMLLARKHVIHEGLLPSVDFLSGGYRLLRARKLKDAYIITDKVKRRNKKEQLAVDDGKFLNVADTQMEGSFLNLLTGAIERIENGEFPVDPQKCDYCDFIGLCRYVKSPENPESRE
ncbi:hypothetical protein MNBD_NITROSPINAE01-372 [hydrothermal vent metagenome]|uniref:UvrD-like helicase C-terminal domain-containing protein n=1 Tax=hydrothermal vent metagenome TaxID=652676 RepID=A0A3B1CFU2_9ZZZZ